MESMGGRFDPAVGSGLATDIGDPKPGEAKVPFAVLLAMEASVEGLGVGLGNAWVVGAGVGAGVGAETGCWAGCWLAWAVGWEKETAGLVGVWKAGPCIGVWNDGAGVGAGVGAGAGVGVFNPANGLGGWPIEVGAGGGTGWPAWNGPGC